MKIFINFISFTRWINFVSIINLVYTSLIYKSYKTSIEYYGRKERSKVTILVSR